MRVTSPKFSTPIRAKHSFGDKVPFEFLTTLVTDWPKMANISFRPNRPTDMAIEDLERQVLCSDVTTSKK